MRLPLADLARIGRAQLRSALLAGMQYRGDFILQMLLSVFWAAAALTPLWVLFSQRTSVAGWRWEDALLVAAWFTMLKGVIEGVIEPSLMLAVEMIRNGRFDQLLLKPADAQLLASIGQIKLWNAADLVTGGVLLGYALARLPEPPTLYGVAAAALLFVAACGILFAVLGAMIGVSFVAVKVDNLIFLFLSLFDTARWPGSIYRGAVHFVFTFVLPFIVMTTYPALALRGQLPPADLAMGLAIAVAFMVAARMVWTRSIRFYTGAGG